MTEFINKRYAINDRKQAELDALTSQVSRQQYKVDQLQAIVDSLTSKKGVYDADLVTATTDRDNALDNLNMVKEVVSAIEEMVRQAHVVKGQTDTANTKTADAANQLSIMVNQLVFSVELIDKLQLMLSKKQETTALISPDLITAVNTAASDANNAVATTLTALNSCYVALSTGAEADSLTVLEYAQSLDLYGLITGRNCVINQALAAAALLQLASHRFQNKVQAVDDAARQSGLVDVVGSFGFDYDGLLAEIRKRETEQNQVVSDAQAAFETASKDYQDNLNGKYEGDKSTSELISDLSEAQKNCDEATAQSEALAELHSSVEALQTSYKHMQIAQAGVNKSQQALATEFSNFTAIVPEAGSLYFLLIEADVKAQAEYKYAYQADQLVNRELTQASTNLASATVELDSLKAGLAAATAAALAA